MTDIKTRGNPKVCFISPLSALSLAALVLSGCGDIVNSPARYGMVKDPKTGLQIGSVVEKNFVTDSSFYPNKQIKVRIRNTSGDQAFNLYDLRTQIENSYKKTGYDPVQSDRFGILVDVNVRYSGQIQINLSKEFGFLGASAGGLTGAARDSGLAIGAGTIAGATLGSILGSYITDDTYIIVADVTVGIVNSGRYRGDGKRITFSRSITGIVEEVEEREARKRRRNLKSTHRTQMSVFAGGRNVTQVEIAEQVRSRMARILGDII